MIKPEDFKSFDVAIFERGKFYVYETHNNIGDALVGQLNRATEYKQKFNVYGVHKLTNEIILISKG